MMINLLCESEKTPRSKSEEEMKEKDDKNGRLCQIRHLLLLLITQETHLHPDSSVFVHLLIVKKIKSEQSDEQGNGCLRPSRPLRRQIELCIFLLDVSTCPRSILILHRQTKHTRIIQL